MSTSRELIDSAFDKLKGKLARKPGIYSPGGLAAKIGREKLGKAAFQQRAAEGRKHRHEGVSPAEAAAHILLEISDPGAIGIPKQGMFVKIAHEENPDIAGGYWTDIPEDPPAGKSKWVPVKSIADASKVCRQFLDQYGLGGGNWTGGLVVKDGMPIAEISYNGRAWKPDRDSRASGDEISLDSPQ